MKATFLYFYFQLIKVILRASAYLTTKHKYLNYITVINLTFFLLLYFVATSTIKIFQNATVLDSTQFTSSSQIN